MDRRNELTLLPKLPLLITESADEFDALRDAFEREIKPRGIIEQMYVHDISSIVWEILRLRRCKVVIINAAFRSALQSLLKQVLRQPGQLNMTCKMRRKLLRTHGSPIKRLRSRFRKHSVDSISTSLPLKRKPSGGRPQNLSCSTGC
jgi:hypothetical protein